jgi:hypothetical protein
MDLWKTALAGMGLNYGIHVTAAWGYHTFCIPHSFWELAQSIVTTASPVCSFALSTMQVTQSNYAAMLSTTVLTGLTGILRFKHE